MAGASTERVTVLCRIAADHPAFAGHFPGRPLLPGVLLLAEVLEAARGVPALSGGLDAPLTLKAAKFLAPVQPGSTLAITLHAEPAGWRFEVLCGELVVARGQFAADAP